MRNVVQRSDALDKKISESPADIQKSVDALVKAAKQNRSRSLLALVLVVLVIIFGTIAVLALVNTSKNSSILASNCQAGNDFRQTEHALWGYILSIPPSTEPTPEQQQQIVAFKDYLNKAFAPRDCNKL